MALPSNDINDLNRGTIIESSDVTGQPGIVVLNADGTALGAPVGGATASNQTDGSQKTQIVDAGGEAVTVTGGKLDVNASVDTTGLATSAKQDDIITAIGNIPGGGGVQYTEGDTDVSITGTAALVEGAANALAVLTQPITDTQLRASDVKVTLDSESVAVTGTFWQATQPVSGTVTATATDLDIRPLVNTDVVTAELSAVDNAVLDNIDADLTTIIGHVDGLEALIGTTNTTLTTIDGRADGLETSNSAIQTAVQLIDDTVQVLGTDTYTEATSKGITLSAVRRDADTSLVNTTNEFGPLQMDANGRLKVEVFSGETLPVSLTSTTVTGTVAVTQSGTWDEVGINDSGNSITVDYATTGSGTATGALRVELPTNGTGVIATVGAVTAITNALPAGTNAIGKLAANSGVDIGDVDVTSIIPGTGATNLGKAEDGAHTTGDVGVFSLGVRSDTLADVSGATGDYIQASHDLKGRVMVGSAPRTLKANQVTTITTSTAETTIVTAVASTFLDLYGIIITNTSATAVTVAIKDATAGTTRLNIAVPAGDTRGFMLPIDAAIKQTAVNNNWTATTQSVTSVIITALTVANL